MEGFNIKLYRLKGAEAYMTKIKMIINILFLLACMISAQGFYTKCFGWGAITHIIINKNAFEQATITEQHLSKLLFAISGTYPDMISNYVVYQDLKQQNIGSGDPDAHRFDYGHSLIDSNRTVLQVDADSQSGGIPLFGIKLIKVYNSKSTDSISNLPKRFTPTNKNFAFGWIGHQLGDKHAHGPGGFSEAAGIFEGFTLPSYIIGRHGINEMAADAIMLNDHENFLGDIFMIFNPAFVHEASVKYYNEVGKNKYVNRTKQIIDREISKNDFLIDSFVIDLSNGWEQRIGTGIAYQIQTTLTLSKKIKDSDVFQSMRLHYETGASDYRKWFNDSVNEIKSFLENPQSILSLDIDCSTDSSRCSSDSPVPLSRPLSKASESPGQNVVHFDIYKAFATFVSEEAARLGAFTMESHVESEDQSIPGSRTLSINASVTNEQAFQQALQNVINEWSSFPTDVNEPVSLSQKIFAKFVNATLTKEGFTFEQVIRYSEDVFPPTIQILSPSALDIVNASPLIISGTAVDDQFVHNFKSYKVEVGQGENPANFTEIGSGTQEVAEGTLATWNITGLSGLHTVKLISEDTMDNSSETKILVSLGSPVFVSSFGKIGKNSGEFNQPTGLAFDAQGNLYIADTQNDRIQKLDANFNVVSAISGKNLLKQPEGVFVDTQGNIFVADTMNHQVKKFDASGNLIMTIGTKGNANGEFNQPVGLGVSSENKMYVSDRQNDRIQVFDASGAFQFAFGTQGSENGQFNKPQGLFIGFGDNVFVADSLNNRLQMFTKEGQFVFSANHEAFKQPHAVFMDKNINVYIADTFHHRIVKADRFGNPVFLLGTHGKGESQFNEPRGVVVTSDGATFYVTDTLNHRVQKFKIKLDAPQTPVVAKNEDAEQKQTVKEPEDTTLAQAIMNAPNPVRGDTIKFLYKLTGKGKKKAKEGALFIHIEVYTLTGKRIATFDCNAIDETCNWQQSLSNGVYVYRLLLSEAGGPSESKIGKIVVVK